MKSIVKGTLALLQAILLAGCSEPEPPAVSPPPAPVQDTEERKRQDAAVYVARGDTEKANGNTEAARVFYQEALAVCPSQAIKNKIAALPNSRPSDVYGPGSDKVPPVSAYLGAADNYMRNRAEDVKLARARAEAEEKAQREERKKQDVAEARKHVEEGRRQEAAEIGREIGRRELRKDWSKR